MKALQSLTIHIPVLLGQWSGTDWGWGRDYSPSEIYSKPRPPVHICMDTTHASHNLRETTVPFPTHRSPKNLCPYVPQFPVFLETKANLKNAS